MKNCDIFHDEETLHKKWEERKKLLGFDDDKDFLRWACLIDKPDYALQDKFSYGKLLIMGDHYVLSQGPARSGLPNSSEQIIMVNYLDPNGKTYWDDYSAFKDARIPDDVLSIAKAMFLKEMKSKCPTGCPCPMMNKGE